jgi:hypothetical protein
MSDSHGYFTIAQGKAYQRMSYALALSLLLTQPKGRNQLAIGVTKEEKSLINPKLLDVLGPDRIIEIPWKDHAANSKWKLENEWKSIYMSPFEHTIKLDTDMLFLSDKSHWFDYLEGSKLTFATNAKTYRGETVTSDYYRKVFTENDLPNVYSAYFYFDKSDESHEFFKLSEVIFNNWERFFFEFLKPEHRPKFVSTDVVFAIAAKILGIADNNKTKAYGDDFPTFVHMKSQLQNWPNDAMMNEDWLKMIQVYFNNDCQLKIGNYLQTLPFHYFAKDFLTDEMIVLMENKLGI